MKRNYSLMLLCLFGAWSAQAALTVNVEGFGTIPEEGLKITVDKAHEDPFSGEMTMELKGDLVCLDSLHVSIVRSEAGLEDEFCCSGQCRKGNNETSEQFNYMPAGTATWFAHFFPTENKQATIVYTFSDSNESRSLTVHYNYSAQGIEDLQTEASRVQKVLKDGIIYIIKGTKKYTIL